MTALTKKVARNFALLGLFVPILLLSIEQILRWHMPLYVRIIEPINIISLAVWPSSIGLMIVSGWNPSSVVTIVISIGANVVLYWLAGIAIGALVAKLRRSTNDVH